MDLMTASTTRFLLEKKYRGFQAPTVRIKVDGIEIVEKLGAGISDVSVDLTSEYAASGCSFDVVGEYKPAQTNFRSGGAAKLLQIGAKVEVELGYVTTETVFYGLIAEVSYSFERDSAPVIHVECMDAKCLLMKSQRLEIRSEKKVAQLVRTLLGQQPVSSYLKGKEVILRETNREPLQFNMESDYDFIVRQAQYLGCEFFIVAGKAYFRTAPLLSAPIMTMSPDAGLMSATFSLRGAPLVKKVKVVGIDPESDREVSGTASAGGKFGKGAGASRMLSSTERTYFDPSANSAAQASSRAKILMKGIENQFGCLECRCVGLPEIVPGRYIRISGLMSEAKKSFYITGVRHTMGIDGYTTSFEARVDSL